MLKLSFVYIDNQTSLAAAFGRLCVETRFYLLPHIIEKQPPSGGCVLKHVIAGIDDFDLVQPPSGGCVLKQLP